jgi:protein ImuB
MTMRRARRSPVIARDGTPPPDTAGRHPQYALPLVAMERGHVSVPGVAAKAERLWFCVYLPNLPLEACGPGDRDLAVIEEQQGVHRVLLAGDQARAAGVLPGQSPNAALALLPTLKLEERSVIREQQVLELLATWLEQFSSFVSIAGPDVLLLEIAGSLKLFGGLQNLRRQIATGLEGQGFEASLAIAPTPLAATWLARGRRRACIRESANVMAALRGLPLSCLDWPPTVLESLAGMGVTDVGDCLRLPREGFARRFGVKRLLQLDRALGRLPDPRTSWRAPERFCADFEMTEEQSDRELLLTICQELLQAHELFLLARQLGTQRLLFTFFHLKAKATSLPLGGARADRAADHWYELLRLRFEKLVLPEPVIAIRLRGGTTQALPGTSGRLAFHGSAPREHYYSMSQLAERLAARIGNESVHGVNAVADHRPQYAWSTRNLFAARAADALTRVRQGIERPLWLLPEPELLSTDNGHPLHQGKLRFVSGPERLETGWWDEHGIVRDYYTAVSPRGAGLWVFRNRDRQSGGKAAWYLHGIFG